VTRAERKRNLALEEAARAGASALVATAPATVRWLLCGRGRPVDDTSPHASYTVVLTAERAFALFADIEASRVEAEERLDELGYEPMSYPRYDGPAETLAGLLRDGSVTDAELEPALAPHRRELDEDERDRYRRAGADAADAMRAALRHLRPEETELEAAATLAAEARRRGFVPAVVLVGGEKRQPLHRHPLPTEARVGRHALLAFTIQREGLHVSMTRLVSFGRPPADLEQLVQAAAEVDARLLAASTAGSPLGEVFEAGAAAYAAQGFPEEWRRHHQGGLTGYKGREVFGAPREQTPVPSTAAVAWKTSIGGGAKSEDTALVQSGNVEVVTRTPDLPEVETSGIPRPGIVEL